MKTNIGLPFLIFSRCRLAFDGIMTKVATLQESNLEDRFALMILAHSARSNNKIIRIEEDGG